VCGTHNFAAQSAAADSGSSSASSSSSTSESSSSSAPRAARAKKPRTTKDQPAPKKAVRQMDIQLVGFVKNKWPAEAAEIIKGLEAMEFHTAARSQLSLLVTLPLSSAAFWRGSRTSTSWGSSSERGARGRWSGP
jgi:hypothetical protein